MQKIVPHLWFDKDAKKASEFYVSVFPSAKLIDTSTLHDTPSGDADIVSFEILGFKFMSISAGPLFKPNPSISFMINFDPSTLDDAREKLDETWEKLIKDGKALMPLDKYPFSKRYGWVEDKYGFSWQLILTDPEGEDRPLVMPSLLFVNDKCGNAEAAREFYLSVFAGSPSGGKHTKEGTLVHYGKNQKPNREGTVMFSDFKLAGTWLVAMDSGLRHDFDFNEAVSMMVYCKNQKEIDYYWEKLSADPKSEQCGWLKDKFGVSWQIIPTQLDEMMSHGTEDQKARVTKALLKMKRLNISEFEKAYDGERK